MAKTFGITLGAMAPSLVKQLKSQGIVVKGKRREHIRHLQEDVDALHRLYVRGVLPDSPVHRARKKLMRLITLALQKKEPPCES